MYNYWALTFPETFPGANDIKLSDSRYLQEADSLQKRKYRQQNE